MGPRSADRGNVLALAIDRGAVERFNGAAISRSRKYAVVRANMNALVLASMGPRSADRGNDPGFWKEPESKTASMGPRSADRGNTAAGSGGTGACWLQWGRDQQIAEMLRRCLRPRFPPCFNGAAISRSRKWDRTKSRVLQAGRLQWGRDQQIAEIIPQGWTLTSAALTLQWGRDQQIAEM